MQLFLDYPLSTIFLGGLLLIAIAKIVRFGSWESRPRECSRCGARQVRQARFCTRCGASLETPAPQS
jgi:ribosomal protein S27AE